MLSLLYPLTLLSDEIHGRIINNKNMFLQYANVILLTTPDTSFVEGAVTDSLGKFILSGDFNDNKYIIKVSCLGYTSAYFPICIGDNKDYKLNSSEVQLKEVVVTEKKEIFKNINGTLIVNVANSVLSEEPTMVSLFTKLPGFISSKGILEVLGKGEPVFYINGMKVQNADEINAINVNDVNKIQLISNPDSRYDANTKYVVKIFLKDKSDGFAIQTSTNINQSVNLSKEGNIEISYKKHKFSSSAYYSYSENKNTVNQTPKMSLASDTLWSYLSYRKSHPQYKKHNYKLYLDYKLDSVNTIGLQINGQHLNHFEMSNEQDSVLVNGEPYLSFLTNSMLTTKINNNHINLFYSLKTEHFNSDLNLDYVGYNNSRIQNTSEKYSFSTLLSSISSDSKINVYSIDYMLGYHMFDKFYAETGGSYIYSHGVGSLCAISEMIAPTNYITSEHKSSVYAIISYVLPVISFHAGLRYEIFSSNYLENFSKYNVKWHKDRFYPYLSVSLKNGIFINTISLTSKMENPPMAYINGQTYYQNKYQYQVGNPNLRPQTSYIFEWNMSYNHLNAGLNYSFIKNYISSIFKQDDKEFNVICTTWENINLAHTLDLNVNYNNSFFRWLDFSVSAEMIKPWLIIDYCKQKVYCNDLNLYLLCNNNINISKHSSFGVDYIYHGGGNIRIYKFRPYMSVDLSYRQSFCDDKLIFYLSCNDIFRGIIYKSSTKINNIYFSQKEDYHEWGFSLNILYRFNRIINLKKRDSSVNDIINRL
jgi:hypothetical protein